MCRIASLFLLQRLKGSMAGDARDFNNMETRAVIRCVFFFYVPPPCKARCQRKFTPFWQKLGEHAPSYATVKNWVAQFKHDNFSTCDAPHPGQPKTVTTPEIIDQIHELIWKDCWNLTKSIAEQLGLSCEQVESIIHEDLDMQKLSARWVPKCLNAD